MDKTTHIQQKVLNFFDQILQCDEATLRRVSEFQGELFLKHEICAEKKLEQGDVMLIFGLKGLHEFLEIEMGLDYKGFRKLIYQGNINEALQDFGGNIELYNSTGKVDESLYKLIVL